jgi:hypothetical protein
MVETTSPAYGWCVPGDPDLGLLDLLVLQGPPLRKPSNICGIVRLPVSIQEVQAAPAGLQPDPLPFVAPKTTCPDQALRGHPSS